MDWDGWRTVPYAPLSHDMALQLIHYSVYSHPADHLLLEMARSPDCPPCLKHVLELVYEADWQSDLLESIRIELKELPEAQAFAKRFKGTPRQQEERIHVNYLEMKVMAAVLLEKPIEDSMLETLALHYAVDLRPSPAFLRAMESAPPSCRSMLGLQHEEEEEIFLETKVQATTPPKASSSNTGSGLKSRTVVVDLPNFKNTSKREEEEVKCLVPETPLKRGSKASAPSAHLILETPPRLSLGSTEQNLQKLRRLELH